MLTASTYIRPITLGIGMAAFVWFTPAGARAGCPILLEPADAASPWREQAQRVEATVLAKEEAASDCRSVRIEVQPEGNALLTFTTSDGRIAARVVHAPEDIGPALQALLVTLPLEKSIESPPVKEPSAPKNPPPTAEPTKSAASKLEPSRSRHRMVIEGFTGARFGLDSPFLAAAFGLRATNLFAPWEIGVSGEWNPLHEPLVDADLPNYTMWSFEANVFIGRRKAFERFHLPFGVSMGIAAVHAEMDADVVAKGRISVQTFQPRIGAYAGFVYPGEGILRFRGGMHFDVALYKIRAAATEEKGLPDLPRLGLGATLGLEIAP